MTSELAFLLSLLCSDEPGVTLVFFFASCFCTKVSPSSYPSCPIASQTTQIITCVTRKKSTIPGPGHRLERPHPRPNSPAPIMSLASKFFFVGIHNSGAHTGVLSLYCINGKVIMLTPTAPPITSINDGSQSL